LKPGGQLVMIDFHKRDLPVDPPASMKIAREDLLAQMETHGFTLRREHTFLLYLDIARPANARRKSGDLAWARRLPELTSCPGVV
jgi:hypothetical protein